MITGDATQLYQVLMNLCVNARDAMPNGGRLQIEVENLIVDEHYARMHVDAKPGPYVVVSIVDNGAGIPGHFIDKIFEPFFTTKEAGKGTGLGLSTVLGIVKSHGGFVNVYSEEGKGAKFRVYLPATKTAAPPHTESTPSDLPMGQGELVLLVDDELAIREITGARSKRMVIGDNRQRRRRSRGALAQRQHEINV
jgi:K+-sensing histidine kinase KdpD